MSEKLRAAAQAALEALEQVQLTPTTSLRGFSGRVRAITDLRAALEAEQQPEPVAWASESDLRFMREAASGLNVMGDLVRQQTEKYTVPLYTHPPREPVQPEPVGTLTVNHDMGAVLHFNGPRTLRPGQVLALYEWKKA